MSKVTDIIIDAGSTDNQLNNTIEYQFGKHQ